MEKNKPLQTRVYDSDGYRLRAEVICFRDTSRKEVLLISAQRDGSGWTIPGGGLEPDETAAATALREAGEEAGIMGHLQEQVGTYEDTNNKTRTQVFVIEYTGDLYNWMEKSWRRQKWCNIPEALELLKRAKPLKVPYLQKACSHGNCSELNSRDPILNGCSYNVQEQKVI